MTFGWTVRHMEKGVEGFADEEGIGIATARKRMTWARDAGLLEKVGGDYKLTPLGKMMETKQRNDWNDHVALMTGDRSMMLGPRPKLDAVAYWVYANWPVSVSTVNRGEISRAWAKTTGDKWGRFTDYVGALESGLQTKPGKPILAWAHIADLDNIALSRSLNREDFVDLD